MQDKHASEVPKKGKSGKQDRLQSLSWLYRDGLSYGGVPSVSQDSTKKPVKQDLRKTHQAPKPAVKINKQPSKHTDDRFASMKWLYRDSVAAGTHVISKREATHKTHDTKVAEVIEEILPANNANATVAAKPKSKQPIRQDKYEAMRWLFEDEAEYQKATADLIEEDAAKTAKKARAKQTRKQHIDTVKKTVQNVTGRVAQYAKSKPKHAAAGLAIVSIIGIGFGGIALLGPNKSNTTAVAGDAVEQKAPEFDTVIPGDDTDRLKSSIAYDAVRKSASFQDELDGKQIVVAQQPIPQRFAADQKVEFEKFAKEINCSTFFQAGDTYACSGLSVKGPQTVSFIKNKLLVFISAESEIPAGAWVSYIENLK